MKTISAMHRQQFFHPPEDNMMASKRVTYL